jgi:hypothetical protein
MAVASATVFCAVALAARPPLTFANIAGLIWFALTAAGAPYALALAFRSLVHRKRWYVTGALLVVALIVALANPVVSLFAMKPLAERLRADMLATAQREQVVGRSAEWLRRRFGPPREVAKSGDGSEHWWYAPGSPFIVHEDFVGFALANGTVTHAYIQVN